MFKTINLKLFFTFTFTVSFNTFIVQNSCFANDQVTQSISQPANTFFEKFNFYSSYSQFSGNYKSQSINSDQTLSKSKYNYLSHFLYFSLSYKLLQNTTLGLSTSYSDQHSTYNKLEAKSETNTFDHFSGFTEPSISLAENFKLENKQSLKLSIAYSPSEHPRVIKNKDSEHTTTTAHRGYSYISSSVSYNKNFDFFEAGGKLNYQSTTMQKKLNDGNLKYSDPGKWLTSSIYGNYLFDKSTLGITITNYRPAIINTNYIYSHNIKGMNSLDLSFDFPIDNKYTFNTGVTSYEEWYWLNKNIENYKYNSTALSIGISVYL